jgi:hypothetical protein
MNDFYKLPKILQWLLALLLLVSGFFPALALIELGYAHPIAYLLVIFYVPIGQFSFTPFFTLLGVYSYYSPMLLGYTPSDSQIDLHSGGSFDYLFVMRKYKSGIEMRNRLLLFQLEGLKKIIQLIEDKAVPESVNIVGTSYFFSNRTVQRIGFELIEPSLFYRVNLFVNFLDLLWMYSLAQGKWAIPKVWQVKKAQITGQKLVENKGHLEALYDKLNSKITAGSTN